MDYIFAPSGLSREIRASTRTLLEDLSPRHIIEWARNAELAVYQDAAAEAKDAWGDPVAAGFLVCPEPTQQPRKLNAALVKHLIQALGERRKLLATYLIVPKTRTRKAKAKAKAHSKQATQDQSKAKPTAQRKPRKAHKAQPVAKAQAASATNNAAPSRLHLELEDLMEPTADALSTATNPAPASAEANATAPDTAAAPAPAPAMEATPLSAAEPCATEAEAPAPSEAAAPLSAAEPNVAEAETSLTATEAPAPSEAAAPLSATELSAAEPTNELPRSEAAPSTAPPQITLPAQFRSAQDSSSTAGP